MAQEPTSTTTDPNVIDAIGNEDERVVIGQLAHAIREANKFVYNTSKFCVRQRITGEIRSLPVSGINDIEIVMLPKFRKNLAGDVLDDITQTKLHYYMIHESPYKMMSVTPKNLYITPQYRFQAEGYLWKVHIVKTISSLNVIQLLRTGPKAFRDWITEEEHRGGALPWGWYFHNTDLFSNSRVLQKVKSESDIFDLIGYHFIPVHSRCEGNATDWQAAFKKED